MKNVKINCFVNKKGITIPQGNRFVLSVNADGTVKSGHVWQTGRPELKNAGDAPVFNPNTGEYTGEESFFHVPEGTTWEDIKENASRYHREALENHIYMIFEETIPNRDSWTFDGIEAIPLPSIFEEEAKSFLEEHEDYRNLPEWKKGNPRYVMPFNKVALSKESTKENLVFVLREPLWK